MGLNDESPTQWTSQHRIRLSLHIDKPFGLRIVFLLVCIVKSQLHGTKLGVFLVVRKKNTDLFLSFNIIYVFTAKKGSSGGGAVSVSRMCARGFPQKKIPGAKPIVPDMAAYLACLLKMML